MHAQSVINANEPVTLTPFKAVALAAFGLAAMGWEIPAAATAFQHSWVAARFAPCEGVGATGSFRVHVSGDATAKSDGSTVVGSLSVYTSAGAYTQNPGSTSASAVVKVKGVEQKKFPLEVPKPPALIPQPKSDETRAVYLPTNTTITVPAGGELAVSAAAVIKIDSGSCALGTSTDTVPLP